jgi:hypothetical protein
MHVLPSDTQHGKNSKLHTSSDNIGIFFPNKSAFMAEMRQKMLINEFIHRHLKPENVKIHIISTEKRDYIINSLRAFLPKEQLLIW